MQSRAIQRNRRGDWFAEHPAGPENQPCRPFPKRSTSPNKPPRRAIAPGAIHLRTNSESGPQRASRFARPGCRSRDGLVSSNRPRVICAAGPLLIRPRRSSRTTCTSCCAPQKRFAEAAECCRLTIAAGNPTPELHNNLGTALKAAGLLEPAAAAFRDAIRLRGDYADAHYNLANALVMLHQLPEAEEAYVVAARLSPADCDTHNNLGALLRLQGKLSAAAEHFEAALAIRADSAEAHRNRALLRLLLGDYEQGWPEYEWRWKLNEGPQPSFSEPLWQGQPLEGSTILLWAEQGLGDTIQFIRYAALVKSRGRGVLVECPRSLHALLRSAAGIDRFVVAEARASTIYVPLLSLPAALGTTLATVPADVPYLHAAPERIAHWKNELAGVEGFKVGIAWQGSTRFPGDYYRSLPLAQFAPVAACPGVQLFSLQKGTGSEQLPELVRPRGNRRLGFVA